MALLQEQALILEAAAALDLELVVMTLLPLLVNQEEVIQEIHKIIYMHMYRDILGLKKIGYDLDEWLFECMSGRQHGKAKLLSLKSLRN